MSRPNSRDFEQELLQKILEKGISCETLVGEFLSYFNSDDTCNFLKSVCDDYDIEYEED